MSQTPNSMTVVREAMSKMDNTSRQTSSAHGETSGGQLRSTQIQERFRFLSAALPADTFKVVRFSGEEGLNRLYRFDITLVSDKKVDLDKLLASQAALYILRPDNKHAEFSGFASEIVQGAHFNGWTFYTLCLQPGFQGLTRAIFNRIFLDKDVKGIVEEALSADSILKPDFAFQLSGKYSVQEFSMQYNESVYDYCAAKLEREGIYYYFDQQDTGERVIFTDSHSMHKKLGATPKLAYSPTSGLEYAHAEEVVTSFSMHRTPVPANVIVRDYNWKQPNVPLEAVVKVADFGVGNAYFYGDGFSTEQEGKSVATIRAEALRCRSRQYRGVSAVSTLRPGFLFDLERHYDASFNREFLITDVTHEGSQEGYLSLVLSITLENPSDALYYRNSFTCIPSEVQFRPERVTARNLISGVISAFVDSSSDSARPEIDAMGRYKVVFPQDTSGRKKGKASCWLRRSQPYGGPGQGSMFPIAPGVEVLVSFLDGNPDRPLLTGVVSNVETGAVERGGTSNISGMVTGGGNALIFNDDNQKQSTLLKAGHASIMMGSGSTDALMTASDHAMNCSQVASATWAGFANIMKSGFSSSLECGSGGEWKNTSKPLSLAQTLSKNIIDHGNTISTAIMDIYKDIRTTDSKVPYSSDQTSLANNIKMGIVALGGIGVDLLSVINAKKKDKKYLYATSLSAEKDSSKIKMQSPMSGYQLTAFISLYILAKGSKEAKDIAKLVGDGQKIELEQNAIKVDYLKRYSYVPPDNKDGKYLALEEELRKALENKKARLKDLKSDSGEYKDIAKKAEEDELKKKKFTALEEKKNTARDVYKIEYKGKFVDYVELQRLKEKKEDSRTKEENEIIRTTEKLNAEILNMRLTSEEEKKLALSDMEKKEITDNYIKKMIEAEKLTSQEEMNLIVDLYKKGRLYIPADKQLEIEKKTDEISSVKQRARADQFFATQVELVKDLTSLLLAQLKANSDFNSRKKSFGGIALLAPEDNLLAASKQEARIASSEVITLQALEDAHKYSSGIDPADLTKDAGGQKGLLYLESMESLQRAYSKITSHTVDHKMHAFKSLHLSNEVAVCDLTGRAEKVGVNNSEFSGNPTTYSSIFIGRDGNDDFLEIFNKGKILSIKQESPQADVLELVQENGDAQNTLRFKKASCKLSCKQGSDTAAVMFTQNSIKANTKPDISLELSDQLLGKVKNNTFTLSSSAGELKVANTTLNLEAAAATLKSAAITLESNGDLKFKGLAGNIKADTQLMIDASAMVKIG